MKNTDKLNNLLKEGLSFDNKIKKINKELRDLEKEILKETKKRGDNICILLNKKNNLKTKKNDLDNKNLKMQYALRKYFESNKNIGNTLLLTDGTCGFLCKTFVAYLNYDNIHEYLYSACFKINNKDRTLNIDNNRGWMKNEDGDVYIQSIGKKRIILTEKTNKLLNCKTLEKWFNLTNEGLKIKHGAFMD